MSPRWDAVDTTTPPDVMQDLTLEQVISRIRVLNPRSTAVEQYDALVKACIERAQAFTAIDRRLQGAEDVEAAIAEIGTVVGKLDLSDPRGW